MSEMMETILDSRLEGNRSRHNKCSCSLMFFSLISRTTYEWVSLGYYLVGFAIFIGINNVCLARVHSVSYYIETVLETVAEINTRINSRINIRINTGNNTKSN